MGAKWVFTLAIFTLAFFSASSQKTTYIQGLVNDSVGEPLPGATIRLSNGRDSTEFLSTTHGSFRIQTLFKPSFILVTMKGYKAYFNYLSIRSDVTEYSVPPIILQIEYEELQLLTVQQVIPITIKKDTIDFHAAAYSMREESMLADLMQKLPGVILNKDSSVTFMGKPISKLMVDGKAFFDKDISTALQILPYNIIDKVEIIDDYGDQARLTGVKTGDPTKVLNIELRKDKRNGEFGSLQGAFGTDNAYITNIVANAFSGERQVSVRGAATNNNSFGTEPTQSMNLNYAGRLGNTWMGSGDGSIWGDHHRFTNGSIQDYQIAGDLTHQEQNNSIQGNQQQQQLNYDWRHGPIQSKDLRITTSFSHQQSSETNEIKTISKESDSAFTKTSQAISLNKANSHSITGESKFYLARPFPHAGHGISLDADLKYMLNEVAGDNLTSTQIQTDNLVGKSLQHYKLDNTSSGLDIATGLHYYIPFAANGLIETIHGDISFAV